MQDGFFLYKKRQVPVPTSQTRLLFLTIYLRSTMDCSTGEKRKRRSYLGPEGRSEHVV